MKRTEAEALGDRRHRLEQRARADLSSLQQQLDTRGDEPPAKGDLYALSAGADAGIEWLVVATDGDRGLTLAAVDGMPLVGVGDLALDPSDHGRRVLRSAGVIASTVERVAAGRRVGVVAPAIVDQFWRRRDLASRRPDPSRAEVSRDPQYRAWVDTRLTAAAAALSEPARVSRQWRPSWWAVAASLMLATVAAWWVVAERTAPPAEAGGVTLARFQPPADPLRSAAIRVIEPVAEAASVVLVFRTLAAEPYADYQLDLVDLDRAEQPVFWQRGGLRLQGVSDIVVMVPAARLDRRQVEARLSGRRSDGEIVALERWRFRVAPAVPDDGLPAPVP